MNIVFFSASSSYVHTLLAPYYLVANCDYKVNVIETNVNIPIEKNIDKIMSFSPNIVAFSCYVFNIKYVRKVIEILKEKYPNIIIIVGGYEVAFDTDFYINKVDYIIKGEGDFSFNQLIDDIVKNKVSGAKIINSGAVKNLDDIKSPYTDEYLSLSKTNRIIYMETSRGCPFQCSYCMSANTLGVRSFSLNRVFDDFLKIKRFAPKLVKLVDRTFNYNLSRSKKIFQFLIDNFSTENTRFHFEMAPELFDEELFFILSQAPKNLFQFEIGVQSYNQKTLDLVNRRARLDIVDFNINKLISFNNIPIHVDLIAGLPQEDYLSFIQGFNRLFLLKPSCLQLGFLKILKGSEISKNCDGYEINDFAPYEIIKSPCLSCDDISKLKKAERILNLYYNSGRFKLTMDYIIPLFFSPYEFFYNFAIFLDSVEKFSVNFSSSRQCDALYQFLSLFLNENCLKQAENYIYEDFINSGNVRKWHKWLKNND